MSQKAPTLNEYFYSNFNHAFAPADHSFDSALTSLTLGNTSVVRTGYTQSPFNSKHYKATGADGILAIAVSRELLHQF